MHTDRSPRRSWASRAASRAAVVALAVVALVAVPLAPAPATAAPFPAGAAQIFIAQGSPTQLFAAVNTGDELEFQPVGPVSSYTYNALAYHVPSRFLYGVNEDGDLLRIHDDGSVEVVVRLEHSVVGAFSGAYPNRFYTRGGGQLRWYDVVTGARGAVDLSRTFGPVDFAWSQGFFWGLQYAGTDQYATMFRANPVNGQVDTFPVPAIPRSQFSSVSFGGAWTYGNGNLGFTNNGGGTVQISVSDPAGSNPVFTAVSFMDGPASSNNDAAASPGDPVDLSLTKEVGRPVARNGEVLDYTVTVRNETAGALSSGYTIADQLPAGLEILAGSLPARCTVTGTVDTGQTFSCAESPLAADQERELTFQARVTSSVPVGTSLVNTARVIGNEDDPVPSNNDDAATTLVGAPRLELIKTVHHDDADDNGNPDVGEQLTWTFEVRNTGQFDAFGVSIDDPQVPAVTPAQQDIPSGGSATFTATSAVTQAMVDAGGHTNTAIATATIDGEDYESPPSSASVPIRGFPGLQSVKSATLVDSNGNGVADEGEQIQYTLTVTNTGNVTLTGVSAHDELVPLAPATADLAPGAQQVFTGTYTVTAADVAAGEVVNVASASGTPPGGGTVPSEPSTTRTETVREGITLVKSALDPDQEIVAAGEAIEYRFVVTNTGNTTLENVTIHDSTIDAGSLSPASATILPGEQAEFTATRIVTQQDIDDAEEIDGVNRLSNTATASGTPVGGSSITSETSTVLTPLVAHEPATSTEKSAVLTTDANGNGKADLGDVIEFTVTVTNTGNVTVSNVVVEDTMLPTGTVSFGSLVPGESASETYTHVVTQADVDAGGVLNVATTTATSPHGDDVPPSEGRTTTPGGGEVVLHAVKSAELDDANSNGFADAGETVQFSVRVWNHGQVTATDVTIDDPMAGAFTPASADIAPGESVLFTAVSPYTVTEDDVEGGGVRNTATARGVDPRDPDVPVESPPTTTETSTPAPALSIVKRAHLIDLDGNGLGDVGETIQFSFVVTNSGNIAIHDIAVDDPMVTGLQPATFDLEPGRSRTVTADPYVITDDDVLAGVVANTAVASGTPDGGSPFTTTPSSTTTPVVDARVAYESEKIATLADMNGNGVADVGETISYVVLVTNTGTLTLYDVAVDDPMLGDMTPATQDVAPGRTVSFTGEPYTVTQADVDEGGVVNVATVTGRTPSGDPLDPQVPRAEVPGPEHAPALAVTKDAELEDTNDNGVADEGERVHFTVTVRNVGNVTLTGVVPVDPMVTGFTPNAVDLAPGEEQVFFAEPYVVTGEDVEAGTVENTATAIGTPPEGVDVEGPPAKVTVPTVDPGLLVTKVAELDDANDNGVADLGETVRYSFVVTNTGNTVLEDVSVDDPRVTGLTPASVTLPAGESVTFTAEPYVVTESDLLAQSIENTATASGRVPGGEIIGSPPSTVTVPPAPVRPALAIEKSATLVDANDNGLADEGEQILFSFLVTNTGNLTQTDVRVVDPMVTGLDPAVVAELAPGEQVEVVADPYVVTASDVAAGGVHNVATATGTGSDGTETSSPEDSVTVDAGDPDEPVTTEPDEDPADDPGDDPVEPDPDQLPLTGAAVLTVTGVALALLAVGGLLATVRRRTTD